MTSIGDALRDERLRLGLKLEYAAAQTKIPLHYLEAMEANQFERLPGGLITRSFLRQYAGTLAVDGEEVIALFRQQFEEPEAPAPEQPEDYRWNLSLNLSRIPAIVWLVAALVGCSAIYIRWQSARSPDPQRQVGTRSAFLQHAERVGTESKTLATEAAETRAPGPHDPGRAPDDVQALHMAITAIEPVWVSISSDGNRAFCGTLVEQQGMEFAATSKITALVGNAGGVTITVNGSPLKPMGGHGEVRQLELTPEGARVMAHTTPARAPGDFVEAR